MQTAYQLLAFKKWLRLYEEAISQDGTMNSPMLTVTYNRITLVSQLLENE
jgi:hypothetical protein